MSDLIINVDTYLPDGITYELSQDGETFAYYDESEVNALNPKEMNDYDRDDFLLIVKASNFFRALIRLPHTKKPRYARFWK